MERLEGWSDVWYIVSWAINKVWRWWQVRSSLVCTGISLQRKARPQGEVSSSTARTRCSWSWLVCWAPPAHVPVEDDQSHRLAHQCRYGWHGCTAILETIWETKLWVSFSSETVLYLFMSQVLPQEDQDLRKRVRAGRDDTKPSHLPWCLALPSPGSIL